MAFKTLLFPCHPVSHRVYCRLFTLCTVLLLSGSHDNTHTVATYSRLPSILFTVLYSLVKKKKKTYIKPQEKKQAHCHHNYQQQQQQKPQSQPQLTLEGCSTRSRGKNSVRLYRLICCLRPGPGGFPPLSQAINIWVNPFIWPLWRGRRGEWRPPGPRR